MLIHLDDEYFQLIKNETKTIELRLNDEKRRKLKIDDIIEFENRKDEEKIYCRVIALHHAINFKKLYEYFNDNNITMKQLGYIPCDLLSKFYTDEEQDKYGVVGIELRKIN